jgi:O-antigen/teichoic acid export membrane protein
MARTLGPTVNGELVAVMAWFGISLIIGDVGQPAALCFYVARDPVRAHDYVATSRALMIITGTVTLVGGIVLAPTLAHGNPDVVTGYRIAFSASIVAFIGASYMFSLQARALAQWNVVRVSQPVLGLIAIVILWFLKRLSLESALLVLAGTMALQFAWAYRCCRIVGLAPGRAQVAMIRPLLSYGVAQIAAVTPTALNAQLDQLVLSQTVPSADLGRYAVAVSLTLLPAPIVSAIGNVAFPHLSAQREVTAATRRLQRIAVWCSLILAVGILLPLAAVSYWMVPLVFGEAYRGAVPLVWVLCPGSVFLVSGQVVGDLLRGRGYPSAVAWSQGLAAVFTVVLLFALVPFVGVYGAAIASTVAYGVSFAAMLRRLRRLRYHSHRRQRKRSLPFENRAVIPVPEQRSTPKE